MATGMYTRERRTNYYPYSEKDYFLGDRFAPGEFGMVAILAVASLLLWAVAIYGMAEPRYDDTAQSRMTSDIGSAY